MEWVLFGLWIFPLLDGVFRVPRWWFQIFVIFTPAWSQSLLSRRSAPLVLCREARLCAVWWTICCIALPSLAFLEQFTEFNLGKHDPKSNAVGVGSNHLVVCSNVW